MKKDNTVYLQHILESIEKIDNYVEKLSLEDFLVSVEAQDAVLRRLEVIGEAVKCLSSEYKESHPQIPWRKIAGMRDVLIHEYFQVDLEQVWNTLRIDLITLKKEVAKSLRD